MSPHVVRATSANVKGRLIALALEAATNAQSDLPAFSPAAMHVVVWTAAAAHWTSHRYRVAVREAAEAPSLHWKARLDRHDVDDTVFWQQTLSPGPAESGRPKLVWPGDKEAKTVKGMRGGLEPLARSLNLLATGLNLTVRNVATHTSDELTEQQAMERLVAYSYLAHLLDTCEVETASAVT